MNPALDVVCALVGVPLIFGAVLSAVRSTILPRATPNRLAKVALANVRLAFRVRASRASSYERRDGIMAMLGPISLLGLLVTWLVVIILGYSLLFLVVSTDRVNRAIELSGSSIFTLGSTSPNGLGSDLLSYSEAGVGLLVVTLLITYLPSIYNAFSRRENGVSLLRVRAGDPPRAITMLVRYWRIEPDHFRLTELWKDWERWFVDVEETHTTFPVLAFFRSPLPNESWITAAGVLLDGASLWLSSVDHPRDPDAALCLRAGFQALRRIADAFELPNDPDPAPGDPITIDRGEWEEAMDELADAGIDVVADRDRAWRDFAGWRVNYDTVLLDLARLVEAPPAPWVSDRSPLRPVAHPRLHQAITGHTPTSLSRRFAGRDRR